MQIKIISYGIAKDIVGTSLLDMDVPDGATVKDVRDRLLSKYPSFIKLKSLRFAVNEDYQSDDYTLSGKDEVVIIPPVSGG